MPRDRKQTSHGSEAMQVAGTHRSSDVASPQRVAHFCDDFCALVVRDHILSRIARDDGSLPVGNGEEKQDAVSNSRVAEPPFCAHVFRLGAVRFRLGGGERVRSEEIGSRSEKKREQRRGSARTVVEPLPELECVDFPEEWVLERVNDAHADLQ